MSRDLLVSHWAEREMGMILLTYIVGPFEFDGYVRVAGVICFDTFDNCEGGDILEKDDGGLD